MSAASIGHNGPPSFRDEKGIPHDIQKMHYFKCDIQALRKAIIDKPLDVRGFYISVLLALYEWMEPLPADDAMAQMRTGIKDIRTYRRMKSTLLDLGLIETGPHGHSNSRFEDEISDYVTEFKKRRKAALDREERARREREKLEIEAQSPPQSTHDYPPQSKSIEAVANGRLPPPLPSDLSRKDNEINGHDTRIVPELSQNSTTTVVPHARVTRDIVRRREEREETKPLPPEQEVTPVLAAAKGQDEFSILNGTTEALVEFIAKAANVPVSNARSMLRSNVQIYTGPALNEAYALTLAKMSEGPLPNAYRYFLKTAEGIRDKKKSDARVPASKMQDDSDPAVLARMRETDIGRRWIAELGEAGALAKYRRHRAKGGASANA